MRYFKATVEYDGTDFAGFQWQHETRTIQGVLEKAIAIRTGQNVRVTGAGRTDAGVHAIGQVISFGVETNIPIERMALALNSALPLDLSVRSVEEVEEVFNARYSASSRLYAYLILNRRTPSALLRRYSAFCPESLDLEAMKQSANLLIGEHDFAAFTNKLSEEQVTLRDVTRLQVGKYRNFVLVRIEANAFLRGMVRNIVGTLLEVGTGKRSSEDVSLLLHNGDRKKAGHTAPPQGLCFLKARYGVRKSYEHLSIKDRRNEYTEDDNLGESPRG